LLRIRGGTEEREDGVGEGTGSSQPTTVQSMLLAVVVVTVFSRGDGERLGERRQEGG